MKKWDGITPQPCWDDHLLAATNGGWTMLCHARPDRWQTMEGHPTDEPLILANSETPACVVCKMLLEQNEIETLTKENWPIEWVPVDIVTKK